MHLYIFEQSIKKGTFYILAKVTCWKGNLAPSQGTKSRSYKRQNDKAILFYFSVIRIKQTWKHANLKMINI